MLTMLAPGEGRFSQPCVLLLGGFDGIHLGHKTLLDAAKRYDLPVVFTLIAGGKAGGELFTLRERRTVLEQLGAAGAFAFPFTEAFQKTSAEDFLRGLFARCTPRAVLCGEDFRFGKGAKGDAALLKNLAPCPVDVLPLLTADGHKISSTSLKKLLAAGDMPALNALLAYPYFIEGDVEHGRHVGSSLGFPTVNLDLPAEKAPPKEGVYGGYAQTKSGKFPCILNYGARPTFGVAEKKMEAFLLDFEGDLYGSAVRIYPTEYYRPVTAFPSAEALKAQIAQDAARAKRSNV